LSHHTKLLVPNHLVLKKERKRSRLGDQDYSLCYCGREHHVLYDS